MQILTKNLKWFFVILLSVGLFSTQAYAIDQSDPQKMIEQISNKLMKKVEIYREELETDPYKFRPFADAYILPYLDAPRMARFVMARFWRIATEQQQQDFVEAFTNSLIRSYAGSMLELNITRVEVGNVQQERPSRAQVTAEVFRADGRSTTIVYRVFLDKNTQNWMIYDVAMEGISLLINYRKSYASEFAKKGIDKVITEMQQRHANFLKSR